MGILFDILDSVLGSNDNQSSNKGFDQQRWDAVVEKINKSLDEGQYSRAESQLGNYYRQYEPEKDYFFYYYRANICVRWLESYPTMGDEQIQKIFNRALDSIRNARKLSTSEEQSAEVDEMNVRYNNMLNEWKSMKSYLVEWEEFDNAFDQLISNEGFVQAEKLLENFYKKIGEDFDVAYYNRKCYCIYKQYLELPSKDSKEHELRNQLEQLLSEFQSLCNSDEDIQAFEESKFFIRKEEARKNIDVFTAEQNFDAAFDEVEQYRAKNPDEIFTYYNFNRLVIQRKWRSTPVLDKEYDQIEHNVIKAYNDWENCCKTEKELQRVKDCYNDDYVTIKGEKEEEKKNALAKNSMEPTDCDDSESRYREEVLLILEDGEIGNVERKLLERKRIKLGLSEEQAKRIEALCTTILTDDEQEYADIYKDLVEEGEPTGKLRKLLDREADALGLSPEQVKKVEQLIK